jgi:hypothetical protein
MLGKKQRRGPMLSAPFFRYLTRHHDSGWVGLNRYKSEFDTRDTGFIQTIPTTIAAMKPNDRSAASTFSLIDRSIVASLPVRRRWGD